ncbi:MAG: hypothetical protein MI799_01895 [Desulfobacterales bacterium]|nr:hypothetical protein [Desulfobacterales bacterium]
MIKGRQYIAFSGHPGLRTLFPGTIYSVNNRKIIRMAIGSLGIKNLVKSGGVITIYITVPLTVLECYLQDQSNFYRLAGNLASDLIKIGIGSLMGAIAGIAMRKVTTFVAPPIAIAIFLGGFTGSVLSRIDEQHQLTEKLIALLEAMGDELADIENETQSHLYRGMKGFLRAQGLRIPVKY